MSPAFALKEYVYLMMIILLLLTVFNFYYARVPNRVVWSGSDNGDGYFCHGMCEADTACVERDTAVGVAAGCPVFQVSFDMASDVGELGADLVVATREEIYLNEMITTVADSYQPVVEFR